jgi:phage replication-related protein YjqB (UPF0714/DUF867 family)
VRVCEPKYAADITYESTNLALGVPGLNEDNLARRSAEGLSVEMKISKEHINHLGFVKEVVRNSPELKAKLLHLVKAQFSSEQTKIKFFGENTAYTQMTKNIESITQTKELVE